MNWRGLSLLSAGVLFTGMAQAMTPIESPYLKPQVEVGKLPAVSDRAPMDPSIVDLGGEGKELGKYGGSLKMLMGRAKDTRMLTVYGYSRLITYEPKTFKMVPDLLADFSVEKGRIFTFKLRRGHKWSDGHPFTAEDFRYWWEDVANNEKLAPSGPPSLMLVDGKPPTFEVIDDVTVRYTWHAPNPDFLPRLAGASPLYIYFPAHYLKQFHAKYADADVLEKKVKKSKKRSWAALHNRKDNLYRMDNILLPVLQPWRITTKAPSDRFVFKRNPFYHRFDKAGHQLPYIDEVIFAVASKRLIPAKTGTGEVDLQARYLRFDNYTFLKQSQKRFPYSTHLWQTAKGAHLAIYANMNVDDPVLKKLFRDVRFRRALSMGVNRHEINQAIYYGLGIEGNNSLLPKSPLYKPEYRDSWAKLDIDAANKLLDEIGLTERDDRGARMLSDGRPLELIVETAGESTEQTDVLELVRDSWAKIGVRIFSKPSQRTVFRNRIFSGEAQMSIWFGLENGLATAENSPAPFAPTDQNQFQWPKWGQYLQTGGKAGEAPDMPEARELLDLYFAWRKSETSDERTRIWRRMLEINADQVYSIGLIAGVLQPVVVNNELRNVPEKGVYNWDPGAHFGIYRPDTFWFADEKLRNQTASN